MAAALSVEALLTRHGRCSQDQRPSLQRKPRAYAETREGQPGMMLYPSGNKQDHLILSSRALDAGAPEKVDHSRHLGATAEHLFLFFKSPKTPEASMMACPCQLTALPVCAVPTVPTGPKAAWMGSVK